MKYREWWIQDNGQVIEIPKVPWCAIGIHVIEKSAYDERGRKLALAQADLHMANIKYEQQGRILESVVTERDQARAELAQAKEMSAELANALVALQENYIKPAMGPPKQSNPNWARNKITAVLAKYQSWLAPKTEGEG